MENNNNNNKTIENMSYHEELIFGLKRWIKKAIDYLDNKEANDFFKDEKSFDATCYTILVISEIASKIKEIEELKNQYKNINFDELSFIYDKCLKEDNINLSYIYELVSKAFPYLLFLLSSK